MAQSLPSDQPASTVVLSEAHAVELPGDALIIHEQAVAVTLDHDEQYRLYLLLHSLFQKGLNMNEYTPSVDDSDITMNVVEECCGGCDNTMSNCTCNRESDLGDFTEEKYWSSVHHMQDLFPGIFE